MSVRDGAKRAVIIVALVCGSCSSPNTDGTSQTPATEMSTSVPRPVMPDVVCMNLQLAQDLIQDQGVFYSRSEDATGEGRNQIVDANWIVIEQNIMPGERFDEGDVVLKVLKEDEAASRGLCQ